LAQGRLG